MHSVVKGVLLSGVTGLGWMALFRLSNSLLTHYFRARDWKMSHHHIMNICEALVSGIQAVTSSVCGIIVVASCRHDVMWAVHPLAAWYAWVAGSYFVYDTVAMYQVHLSSLPKVPERFVTRLSSYLKRRTLLVLVYRRGVGDFFVGCFYCVELSGPFTNLRIILSRTGLKDSRWYTLNGIAMIVSFATCRVLAFPYMYLAYGAQYNIGIMDVIWKIPVHCNVGSLMVLLPQLHWLRLMVLGAVKMARGKRVTEAEEKID
ncbi:Ceramide synthase-like [Homarus americanus]|uniref:Ceramide synthase-like n=1 Tax=Homarus americanus TaxID=6706 RepID=A0A8J5N0H3_HOMAM|nr:Ceramide synthase-like [Homarus americanus]